MEDPLSSGRVSEGVGVQSWTHKILPSAIYFYIGKVCNSIVLFNAFNINSFFF